MRNRLLNMFVNHQMEMLKICGYVGFKESKVLSRQTVVEAKGKDDTIHWQETGGNREIPVSSGTYQHQAQAEVKVREVRKEERSIVS